MLLYHLNKYTLNFIFSHLAYTRKLNVIRYNKKINTKLEIALYAYQKKYFEKIITPALLKNSEILIQNKIFNKNTLDKLKLDWEKDSTEIIQEKDLFHFNEKTKKKNLNENKILNISLKEQNLLKKTPPNLIELNISNIANLELPCLILLNLETLSLKNIFKLKILNKEENISLNKLKHLYLNNISFHEENKIKINLNNLKYLDLRIKEQDGESEDSGFDNDDNKRGFYKENTLENLINIFNFEFLSIFKIDKSKFKNELEEEEEEEEDNNEDMENEDVEERYQELEDAFKKPEELFDKKYLYKYDFFNLEILYEYFTISGAAEFQERFIYKYLFAKTKGNKYLFKTEYINYEDNNGETSEVINKEKRYCNMINYKDYYFIDNEEEIRGNSYNSIEHYIDYEKVNSLNSNGLIKIFENFKKNKNKLETISIEDLNLDIIKLDSFLKDLKKFQVLKCFYITKECIFKNNKKFIDLLTSLSKIKSLYLIEIVIKGELKLTKNDEKKINEIFPDISIKKGKNESHIKWRNNKYQLN